MTNIKVAAQIAEFKYPSDKHTIVWLFDQSSCHRTFAEDALNTKVMNVRPGGVDTMWVGKVQRTIFDDGTPKGMKQVLHCTYGSRGHVEWNWRRQLKCINHTEGFLMRKPFLRTTDVCRNFLTEHFFRAFLL